MNYLISPRFKRDSLNPYQPGLSKYTQFHLVDLVRSKIESGEYKLENFGCPCGAESQDITISEIDRYGLPLTSVLCLSCGTVRINPYLNEKSLSDFYTNIYRKMYGVDRKSGSYDHYFLEQSSYAKKILSVSQNFLKPGSWICEVGCGGGGALKVFQDYNYNVAGCDFDHEVMKIGESQGVKNLYYGSLDTVAKNLPEIKFDLIYLHHVFEHLQYPIAFLENCKKYLSSDGKIIVVLPDIRKIDQFGRPSTIGNLLMYLHIAHKYNFSVEGMRRLCYMSGYSLVQLNPNSKIKTRFSNSPELWVQMTLEVLTDRDVDRKLVSDNAGIDMLKYLQRTEKLYSLGLCRGQILNKLNSIKYPGRVLQKIKKVLSSKK